MSFYSLLKELLLPPGLIVVMLMAALLLVQGRLGRLLILGALSLLLLMTLPAGSELLIAPLEPYPALTLDQARQSGAQAILVLGAGRITAAQEYGGDTLDENSLVRVRYGAYLQRATGLPLYLSGGGMPWETEALADLMAGVLKSEFGIEVAGVENRSRTSWENATYSKEMLERDGIHHVLLVSQAWHLPRAVAACERAGLRVTPAPTRFYHKDLDGSDWTDWMPDARTFTRSYYAIHEHLGQVWYWLQSWLDGASVVGKLDHALGCPTMPICI